MGRQNFDPNPIEKLNQRGIAEHTCRVFGLTGQGQWLTYTTPAGTRRQKNMYFGSNDLPKYLWPDGKPSHDVFYHAPNFADLVQAAGGRAWVVSGEPDVWAGHSAGNAAFSFAYSETADAAKHEVNLFCLQMGITELHAAPDVDPTGQGWGSRLSDHLGPMFTAHRLPGEIEHYDIGKAWVDHLKTGQGNFESWLLDLPVMTFDPPAPPKPRRTPLTLANNEINPLVADALRAAALGESGGRGSDIKIPILSTESHKHDKPGLHCMYYVETCSAYEHSRRKWIGGLELCERWNIDVDQLGGFYKRDNHRPPCKSEPFNRMTVLDSTPPETALIEPIKPAPVVITTGQKVGDFIAQTFPGPVNAFTMDSCDVDVPSIVALNPPYVLVMPNNDPPSEQIEAEKRAAALRAVLTCPVLVVPPPQGYKDFADAVADGYDVGSFWAGIVAPVSAEVIGLLCDYTKRYDWVKDAYGDLTNLAALLWVWHKGIERGLIGYDTPLTVNALVELSQMIGEPVSIKVIRSGVQQALTFDMWVVKSTFPTLDTYLNTLNKIPLSKLGKVGNNTGVYIPRSAFIQYQNLATALENQLDTPPHYWATAEFLEELARCGIHDRVTPLPLDQLNRLVFLRDPAALVSMPFVWPDGFTLSDYPNKRENERPGVPKCLRVGWLRYLHDQNTAEILNSDMEVLDGWQVSAAALAALVGIAISSVSEYRRAAGLTTYEQKPETIILNDPSPFRQDMADLHRNACEWRRQDNPDYDGTIEVSNPVGQLERILDKYKGGVRVYLGYKPSYVTPENHQQILNAVANIDGPIRVEIQLPSIQYAAPLETIETIHNERSDRHKKRVERAQKERAAAGDDLLTEERNRHTPPPPQIALDAPEIAEAGYSKVFVYYHLLRLLPDLLEAAKTSLLIARVLVGYGLMKGDTMPKNEAYKDADLEAAPVVIPTPTANPLPVVTAAPTNRTISPVGQGGYPFGKEKYRLPGLPTDLPNYRDLQKGA